MVLGHGRQPTNEAHCARPPRQARPGQGADAVAAIGLDTYAAARIPWAWLVSLPEKTLTIYSAPSPDERRFQREAVLRPGDTATHLPTCQTVPVAEIF